MEGQIPRLRTMTRKSKIGWGQYEHKTVQDVLRVKRVYILWMYYNVEWANFTDDILEELYINEERRIDKPGISKEKWEEVQARLEASIAKKAGAAGRFIVDAYNRRKKKDALMRAIRETSFTKGQMQAMNHGHIKFE